jgi:hypothetical protein
MAKKLGKRFNKGKSAVEQIPYEAEEEIGMVFLAGEAKYGKNNWRDGLPFTQFIGCAKRHMGKFSKGINLDKETKRNHIAHAATNLIMLLWMIENRPDLDDRWKKNIKKKK